MAHVQKHRDDSFTITPQDYRRIKLNPISANAVKSWEALPKDFSPQPKAGPVGDGLTPMAAIAKLIRQHGNYEAVIEEIRQSLPPKLLELKPGQHP